ncbi:MAG: phosphoribosylformylglycinamidine synthase subunit PurQ [Pseudomonadota bacterium]
MRAAVIQFPGSNCDRDLKVAFDALAGNGRTEMVWHKEASLPDGIDIVGIPGGFSFGDYLRCGAIAAKSPIMQAVVKFAERGGYVLGICNGFQVLTESGLLPGVLMQNAGLRFICKTVELRVETAESAFTSAYSVGTTLAVPVAHHEGNYRADEQTLSRLEGEDRVAFRYLDNPNGAANDIAGILSANRRVLGMMPHPERLNDPALGGTDGKALFTSLSEALVAA